MFKPPVEFQPATFLELRLDALIDELLGSEPAARTGKTARTLVRGPHLTAVLTVLRKGHRIAEHRAAAPVIVVPLRGEVVFSHAGGTATVAVAGSGVLAMGPGHPHTVQAQQDSAFLLLLGPRA